MRLTRNRRSSSMRLAAAWSVALEGTVGPPSWPFTWGGEIVTVGWADADPLVRKRMEAHADIKTRRAVIASTRRAKSRFAMFRIAAPIMAPERSSPTANFG